MSASQITPKANPVPLPGEKSLPEPPAASSPDTASAFVATTSFATHTVKALPPRPPLQRSWTEHRPVPAQADSELPPPRTIHRSRDAASFLDSDPELQQHRSQQPQLMDPFSYRNIEPRPTQPFDSPYDTLPDIARITRPAVDMPSTVKPNSSRRPPRPSLPAAWKSNAEHGIAAPATPPRFSSADSASSKFSSGQNEDSPLFNQRTTSYFTPFPSNSSVRTSSSTHNSIWTERSLASCATSPACTPHGLQSEDASELFDHKGIDTSEATEELDENAVGLGITSDHEQDASSRRSSAAPISPAHVLPSSAKVLQGPFSHHRAPSWTRRVDISPLTGSPSHRPLYERGENLVAPLEGGLRSLGLGITSHMQRALSDVTPVSPPSSESASVFMSASSAESPRPSIPLRRDSRKRCSSDSANYRSPSSSSHAKHSPSHSISSIASNSGRITPAISSKSNLMLGCDLSSLQSPPRSSSLRPSPSASSPLVNRDGLQKKAPAVAPLVIGQISPGATMGKVEAVNEPIDSVPATQRAPDEVASDSATVQFSLPAPSLRTTSAASGSRRMSDVSINSFLQNGEFNHIIGASSRMRWDDGLYDFDETAETDSDESRAVKTAEEGSATIVQGRHLTVAQIEAETGPNTTHLLLGCNHAEGLLEVLERALPLTTNLLVLDLSNCNLDRLPDAIGACIALEELDISGNLVGSLPDWILNLRALRTLSADGIDLDHLPSSLIQLQELQRLSLRNNRLVFLPSWLHRMSKLSSLFAEGNHFRGPWRDIVAPLFAQPSQALAPPFRAVQQSQPQHSAGVAGMHTGVRSPTQTDSALPASRPFMSRMRSANDLQAMLTGRSGPQSPPTATPDAQSEGSGYFSPIEAQSRSVSDHEDSTPSCAEEEDPHANGGKWGGFLKKIGRKASSHRLASAYHDQTISPSQSRFPSPKAARKSLRSSGRPTRSNSRSEASAPVMTPSQSEPVSRPGLPSLNLAAIMAEHRGSPHAPMTPLEATSEPFTLGDRTRLLQPITMDAEAAKKAKRRSFLPVHAFAQRDVGMPMPQMAGQLGLIAQSNSPQQELDEESLARHRNRLRALMHYLRDLDDLSAARTEAASFVEPSRSAMAHIRDAGSHSRTPSMHRAESSNPSTKSRDSGGEYVASTAASSISEGASSEPARLSTARCSKDDSVRRFRIIAEIISTERTYVKGLSELVDIYVKPSLAPADGSNGVAVIPPNEHRAVFGNVEALLQFHRTVFLPSLVTVASPVLDHDQDAPGEMPPEATASVAEKVASVFSTHAAFFKMYTSYINNCDSAQNRISAWMAPSAASTGGGLTLRGAPGKNSALQAFSSLSAQEGSSAAPYPNSSAGGASNSGMFGNAESTLTSSQRKKIKTFMKRCRTHPRHTQLNVESYLLLPVQRIPRYRLLLEDLVKSTDTARLSDTDSLSTALEHVTQIASKVNESKRQSEQDRKLLAWQYRIRGPVEGPLVQPHRRLLKDGSLQLKRTVRRIPGFVRSNRSASVGGPEAGALRDMVSADNVLSADHLQQVTEDQNMALILCSDVVVLCVEQAGNRDPLAPVRLRSMLKLMRPVEILGGVNLRVVDRSEILYLAAASPAEAVAWKTAFDLHFYQ